MANERHGKNGLIYISGSEWVEANSWSVSIAHESAEYRKFGDSWVNRKSGINSWSGTLTGWHNQDDKGIQDAATAGTTVALLIYPDRSDLTTYYSGNALFEFEGNTDMTSVVSTSGSFTGDGTLTMTGFSS